MPETVTWNMQEAAPSLAWLPCGCYPPSSLSELASPSLCPHGKTGPLWPILLSCRNDPGAMGNHFKQCLFQNSESWSSESSINWLCVLRSVWQRWGGIRWQGSQSGTREQSASKSLSLPFSALVGFRSGGGGAQGKFGGKINSFAASVSLFSCSVPWFNYRTNCHSSSHGAGCIPYILGFQSGCIWYKTNIFFSFSNSHKLIDNNGYFLGLPFSGKVHLQ